MLHNSTFFVSHCYIHHAFCLWMRLYIMPLCLLMQCCIMSPTCDCNVISYATCECNAVSCHTHSEYYAVIHFKITDQGCESESKRRALFFSHFFFFFSSFLLFLLLFLLLCHYWRNQSVISEKIQSHVWKPFMKISKRQDISLFIH